MFQQVWDLRAFPQGSKEGTSRTVLLCAGSHQVRQWELAVEKAAAELQNTEEELQEATTRLLSLQARCAEATKEVQSQQSAAEQVPSSLTSL
jgi:hypothetical protein